MPQIPTAPENKVPTPPAGARPPVLPPEEQFWKRYSPHNEFSVSGATSLALHIVGLGVLVLIALLWLSQPPEKSDVPDMEPVAVVEEGPEELKGTGKGGGGGGNDGSGIEPREAASDDEKTQRGNTTVAEEKTLQDPEDDAPIDVGTSDGGKYEATEAPASLNIPAQKAYKVLTNRQKATGGAGSRGSDGGRDGGKDGGRDKGTDKGVGSGTGGGGQAKLVLRQKRQLRWRVIFHRADGQDYLNQLRALKARLVIAETARGSTNRLVYRKVINLIDGLQVHDNVDVRQIKGIFWIDDKPESVDVLARALHLRARPPLIAAFFSERVENNLRRLEKQKFPGSEDRINETIFQVVEAEGGPYQAPNGRHYKLVCREVTPK